MEAASRALVPWVKTGMLYYDFLSAMIFRCRSSAVSLCRRLILALFVFLRFLYDISRCLGRGAKEILTEPPEGSILFFKGLSEAINRLSEGMKDIVILWGKLPLPDSFLEGKKFLSCYLEALYLHRGSLKFLCRG